VSRTNRPSWLRWWRPEILATSISVAAFITLVAVLWSVDGRAQQYLTFPHSISFKLNALVALLSSISRGALMVPIGSVMSQEVWIWLSERKKGSSRYGQLLDLELSDAASRGSLGSLQFLFRARRRYFAATLPTFCKTDIVQQVVRLLWRAGHDHSVSFQYLHAAADRISICTSRIGSAQTRKHTSF